MPSFSSISNNSKHSDGDGEFTLSASGMSAVGGLEVSPDDNGNLAYNSGDFSVIDGVCTFTGDEFLTCGLIDKDTTGSCGYGVKAEYQDGRAVLLEFFTQSSSFGERLAAKN